MDSAEKISKEISVYLDRIEELEDGSAEAVLLIDEGGDEYSGEFGLPTNFLPADASDGDYLTLKIARAETETPRESTAEIATGEKFETAGTPRESTAETATGAKFETAGTTRESTAEIATGAKFETAGTTRESTAEIATGAKSELAEIRAKLETLDGEDAELTADGSKLIFPANFLPDDASAGEIFTIEIFRDENKTNAALDKARQLLKELE